MKRILALFLILTMTIGLFGCAKAPDDVGTDVPDGPSTELTEPEPEPESEPITVAVCMGSINHPVHRIVQTGFMLKAEELGMNGVISGLDEGSMRELIAKWDKDVQDNNVFGALLWTGDDSCYDLMKKWKSDGRYTVVPHFIHDYEDTKYFLDKNISSLEYNQGRNMADYIVNELNERGITSGSIGVTQNGPSVTTNKWNDGFRARMTELNTPYNILDTRHEGAEITEATSKTTAIIRENPDIVAAVGFTGNSAQVWVNAMEATGRTDLVIVGLDYTENNMELVENDIISAIVCQPLYEEGEKSAEALFDLYNGSVFNESEDTWFEELEAPVADKDDMPYYRDIWQKMYDYFGEE